MGAMLCGWEQRRAGASSKTGRAGGSKTGRVGVTWGELEQDRAVDDRLSAPLAMVAPQVGALQGRGCDIRRGCGPARGLPGAAHTGGGTAALCSRGYP